MVGLDSLLQALGGEGDGSAAKQLRAEIERLEQQVPELVDYDSQEEDDEEEEEEEERVSGRIGEEWKDRGGVEG